MGDEAKQEYRAIAVSKITPNPWNPRQRFEGEDFDALTASIREKGIIQPILVRPVGDGYQVVAGERRYRAAKAIAEQNGGPEAYRVPAVVRHLTDDAAFELTVVENLQREDLTPLEEARSFEEYLNRKGMEALPELADRTGIHPRYIRRRVAVLGLPKTALNAWEKGKLKYGHLEVLSRLKNRKEINRYVGEVIEWRGGMSVRELARRIDMESPLLSWARFDIGKAGCRTCAQNSDVQKELFGTDDKKTRCLDPACFRRRQSDHLTRTWKRTGYYRQHHTTGFRFRDRTPYGTYHNFSWQDASPDDDCRKCPDFVTLIHLDGDVDTGQACLGSQECFDRKCRAGRKAAAATSTDAENGEADPGPRVAWHGEFFRERFYETALPERMKKMTVLEDIHLQMLALLDANHDLAEWFARRHGLGKENDEDDWGYFNYSLVDDLAPEIFGMDVETAMAEHRAMVIEAVMQPRFGPRLRRVTADYLGIDLKKKWRITKEYLGKKTIKEMLALGEDLGVFRDRKAQAFLYEVLGKKRNKWASCRKGELIRVFLESGVDLAGKVPAEILAE